MKRLKRTIFVVCVDRDDDLGRKANVRGPIIGKEKVTQSAQKLILTDPTESDANAMFAAVKKYEESKLEFKNVEVVVLTGESKNGLRSDKEINRQIEILQKKHIIDGWILVTDGAEDAQVLPILQSRAKIISTEQILIKQAQAVESTFYTIKEALKDPGMARLFLGLPGLALLTFFVLGEYSLQAISLILGTYLLLKGFGIEEKIVEAVRVITRSIVEQRISVVMYIAAIISPFFGIWLAYLQLMSSEFIDITIDIISAFRLVYPFLALAGILLLVAKAIDSMYEKKAYKLSKYLVQSASVLAIWAILDAGTLVFLRQSELAWFPANIMGAFILLVITMRVSKVFDIRNRVTNALIGVHISDEEGNYLGKVIEINKKKQTIIFNQENKAIERKNKQFILKNGKIILLA